MVPPPDDTSESLDGEVTGDGEPGSERSPLWDCFGNELAGVFCHSRFPWGRVTTSQHKQKKPS